MTENIKLLKSVADPHHFGADTEANPSFYFEAEPDPTFTSMQICFRIRNLFPVKVMKICDQWSTDPPRLHFAPLCQGGRDQHDFSLAWLEAA
jgi:hypothetical protein